MVRKFDLKGSLLGRETKLCLENNSSKTLKDKDFIDLKKMDSQIIEFSEDDIDDIESTIKTDISILSLSDLMDYSFFITKCKRIEDFDVSSLIVKNRLYYSKDLKYMYFIGIIDYLTKFNSWKKLENTFKTIMNYSERTNISAVDAQFYSKRFFEYMSLNILSRKNNLQL